MTALITVDAVPEMPADPAALVTAADALAPAGRAVGEGIRDAEVTWRGLPDVYDAPETATAVAAIAPVTAAGTDFEEAAIAAAAALGTLGEELWSLSRTRTQLVEEVEVHRADVLAFRGSRAANLEDPGDPLSGWGPYGYSRNVELQDRCTALQARMDAAVEECVRALRRIGEPSGVTSIVGTGGVILASGADWRAVGEQFRTALALSVLDRLAGADAKGIERLLREHPEWATLIRDTPPVPSAILTWWTGLGSAESAALVAGAPALVGALGGVPASARVTANRTLAETRHSELRGLIDNRGYTLQAGTYERVRIPIPEAWQSEFDYLTRVLNGEVQLYLYDRPRGQIIEMFGNPEQADVIMAFMPGTNTTMESFYDSTANEGITALTSWQVNNTVLGTDVAGFVVKQGEFPQLGGDIIATGPQNNDMMEALGGSYAQFAFELNAITPGTPLVSIEHSAGSAAGGAAEMAGAHFDSRISLSGIGMTNEWQKQPDTDYYAMQAPNDINKNFDGIQAWNWGYATRATQDNGFTEMDSGIDGSSRLVYAMGAVSPPLGFAMDLPSQLDHHNQIISSDISENGTVLRAIRDILSGEAKRVG